MKKEIEETRTKGNVIVENIKIGDIHYEFGFGMCIKTEVITLPMLNADKDYEWKSRNLSNNMIVDYLVSTTAPSYYQINLYDYEAYLGCRYI